MNVLPVMDVESPPERLSDLRSTMREREYKDILEIKTPSFRWDFYKIICIQEFYEYICLYTLYVFVFLLFFTHAESYSQGATCIPASSRIHCSKRENHDTMTTIYSWICFTSFNISSPRSDYGQVISLPR